MITAIVGLVSAAVAGVAVYLHQSAATQAKLAAAVTAAVADAKKAAASVAAKV
jgi:hypothetical protein